VAPWLVRRPAFEITELRLLRRGVSAHPRVAQALPLRDYLHERTAKCLELLLQNRR
jgi:hypothetical protein